MDLPRDPFGTAVGAIRARLRSGRLVQGEQLMGRDLARALRLSPTPVREALARLAGEGLIEDRRGVGYFAWRLDAVDLTELYDLQVGYLQMALGRHREADTGVGQPPPEPPAGASPVEAMEIRLMGLIQLGRSLSLQRLQNQLADRLAPARRVEALVLQDLDAEWSDLDAARLGPDPLRLDAWIKAYGARRRQAAPGLVSMMRSGSGAAPV